MDADVAQAREDGALHLRALELAPLRGEERLHEPGAAADVTLDGPVPTPEVGARHRLRATLTKYETAAVKLFTLKDLLYIDRDGEALLICTKHGLVPAAIIFYYEILMGMGTPEFEAAGIKGAELRKTFVHARMKVQEDRPIWRGLGYLAAMATMHEDDLAEEVIKFETWMDNQYHEERVYDHVEALGCGCCH